MTRRYLQPVLPRLRLASELGVPASAQAATDAWLNRIRGAEHGKAAHQMREAAREWVAQLEQRRTLSVVQADRLYSALDRQWYDRLAQLEQAALTGLA